MSETICLTHRRRTPIHIYVAGGSVAGHRFAVTRLPSPGTWSPTMSQKLSKGGLKRAPAGGWNKMGWSAGSRCNVATFKDISSAFILLCWSRFVYGVRRSRGRTPCVATRETTVKSDPVKSRSNAVVVADVYVPSSEGHCGFQYFMCFYSDSDDTLEFHLFAF